VKIIRQYVGPVLALVLSAGLMAAVVLYQLGYYDLSFIPRDRQLLSSDPAESHRQTGESLPQSDPDGQNAPPEEQIPPGSTGPSADGKEEEIPAAEMLAGEGYLRSDTVYDPEIHRIGRVTGGIPLPDVRSVRESSPALSLYMGYVLVDNGSTADVLRGDGSLAFANLSAAPAYMRDMAGRPLFSWEEGYYYLVEGTNQMVEVETNALYAPVLSYDYPLSAAENTTGLYRYCVETVHERLLDPEGNDITDEITWKINTGVRKYYKDPDKIVLPEHSPGYTDCVLWGYANANGYPVIEAKYYFASEFNANGVAVVADVDGRISLINRSGRVLLNAFREPVYLNERNRRPVSMGHYLPESFGLESLGMFTFSHGLTMVRYCQNDYLDNALVHDANILVDINGREFDIPQGYNLINYSDGVLLLEKDGYYGYLDYTGCWIVQPIYTYAQPFMEGLAVVGYANGRKCVVDTRGEVVIPFVYTEITNVSSGVIAAYSSSEGWVLYNKMAMPDEEG